MDVTSALVAQKAQFFQELGSSALAQSRRAEEQAIQVTTQAADAQRSTAVAGNAEADPAQDQPGQRAGSGSQDGTRGTRVDIYA